MWRCWPGKKVSMATDDLHPDADRVEGLRLDTHPLMREHLVHQTSDCTDVVEMIRDHDSLGLTLDTALRTVTGCTHILGDAIEVGAGFNVTASRAADSSRVARITNHPDVRRSRSQRITRGEPQLKSSIDTPIRSINSAASSFSTAGSPSRSPSYLLYGGISSNSHSRYRLNAVIAQRPSAVVASIASARVTNVTTRSRAGRGDQGEVRLPARHLRALRSPRLTRSRSWSAGAPSAPRVSRTTPARSSDPRAAWRAGPTPPSIACRCR